MLCTAYPDSFPTTQATATAVEAQLQQALAADSMEIQHGRARILLSANGSLEVQVIPSTDAAAQAPPPPQLVLDSQASEGLQASPFVACKTTHRPIYDAAASRTLQQHPQGSLVLLHNSDGHITEANIANVAVLLPAGGEMQLVTPPVSDGLLAGTMRSHLLEAGQIVEGTVTVDDFKRAALNGWRVVCMNSVRGMFD
ncbi:hypothetical protein EV175_007395, partial [Coemansia sp. RSA 1933]